MHIIVCGFPRSGSTLFYNMLRTTVQGYRFYDREILALSVISDEDKITKRPMDVFDAEAIAARTEACFILMLRDPRGVLTSVHANSEGQYKASWDESLKTGRRGIAGRTPGLIANYDAMQRVPNPVFVKYEDLVTEPHSVQATIGEEFGFELHGHFADFYLGAIPPLLAHQMNRVRPLDRSRLDAWREHPERIREQFNACPRLFDMLFELGYEKDRRWFKHL